MSREASWNGMESTSRDMSFITEFMIKATPVCPKTASLIPPPQHKILLCDPTSLIKPGGHRQDYEIKKLFYFYLLYSIF
jgi:hypothetical protein